MILGLLRFGIATDAERVAEVLRLRLPVGGTAWRRRACQGARSGTAAVPVGGRVNSGAPKMVRRCSSNLSVMREGRLQPETRLLKIGGDTRCGLPRLVRCSPCAPRAFDRSCDRWHFHVEIVRGNHRWINWFSWSPKIPLPASCQLRLDPGQPALARQVGHRWPFPRGG
jgi:hypothetical protein